MVTNCIHRIAVNHKTDANKLFKAWKNSVNYFMPT